MSEVLKLGKCLRLGWIRVMVVRWLCVCVSVYVCVPMYCGTELRREEFVVKKKWSER